MGKTMAVSSEQMLPADLERDTEKPCTFGHDKGFPPSARSLLISMIEGEIIPRLLLAHTTPMERLAKAGNLSACGGSESMARLFLSEDSANILSQLQLLVDAGMSRDRIYLELLAPIARTISIFWEEGRCSLDEVVHGLSCVAQVLQELQLHDRPASDSR
jgi:MerR family transcriptional regulator, light-induced transcriptional regulator